MNEEARIRQVYAKRDSAGIPDRYRCDRPDALYMSCSKMVTWARAFNEVGLGDLGQLDILDVGCGHGVWLRMLLDWGASPTRLHGMDLLPDRIDRAKALSPPGMDLQLGNACHLAYGDESMDLVAASTVYSSILDQAIRHDLAQEMARVVRPSGWIAIFDYAISDPRNPDTIGIKKSEIGRLFPKMELKHAFKLIFPPPLLRLLPSRLLGLARFLELLCPFLCTHRLYLIRK